MPDPEEATVADLRRALIEHVDAALDTYAEAKAWRSQSGFDRGAFGEHARACLSLARSLGYAAEADALAPFETAPLEDVVSALQRARRRAEPARVGGVTAAVAPLPRRPRYRPGFWRRFL